MTFRCLHGRVFVKKLFFVGYSVPGTLFNIYLSMAPSRGGKRGESIKNNESRRGSSEMEDQIQARKIKGTMVYIYIYIGHVPRVRSHIPL